MNKEIRMSFEEYEALNNKLAQAEKTLSRYQENYKVIDLDKQVHTVDAKIVSTNDLGVYLPSTWSFNSLHYHRFVESTPIYNPDFVKTDSELVLIIEKKHNDLMEKANDKINELQKKYDDQVDLNLKITEDRDSIKEKLDRTIYETSKRWNNRFKFWK